MADDEYLDDLEHRLRDCIDRHGDSIRGLTADVAATRQSFVSSVIEKVAEADSISSYEAPMFFKLVSIDVDVGAVDELLLRLVSEDTRVAQFFEQILHGISVHDVLFTDKADRAHAKSLGFVTQTHVTLAHCRDVSQSELRSTYAPVLGAEIDVRATGLLWNEHVMALAVTVADATNDGESVKASLNSFVHITVWCGEDVSPVTANDLQHLVETNEAQRLNFESPSPLRGVITLWNM